MKSLFKLICFIITFFTYNIAFSQFSYCDSLTHPNKYIINLDTNVRYLSDYVKYRYPKQTRFIDNRYDLHKIPLWLNDNNRIILKDIDKSVDCRINIGEKLFDAKQYFYPLNGDSLTTIIEDKKLAPFGITVKDRSVRYIESMSIQNLEAPDSAYSRLFNPNICETFLSIKPITAYLSKCENYIYIYIFGEVRNEYYPSPTSFELSYMAKLIFSRNGHYINRIVLRGDILCLFGFYECPYFIGF